ncbi:cell wall metabolism sensor histidine kinase WalK [Cytobacillus solani]|uniref:histidine kinase n=1 Tax=Cytobacillus solani TaxID=1637975 RepID=A0A0Q3TDD6_9BACI|nr:HAMP domain-containing sensor histidine kinase [Cytobacillus solani]KQL21157.1 histidine kinase [Cytobacillus solani]USK54463.1 cell wall metabolism sensor histidine kinase WalK [Cytobacillus solani]
MKKLSIKLGILFFLIIFGLITVMFFFLHMGIAESRVEEELKALQARGNSHRAILEKHFNKETIDHVVLMESESMTDVIITNKNGKVLNSSSEFASLKKYLKLPASPITAEGQIVEDNWKDEPYIATISPVEVNGQLIAYVFMFENTASVHSLIQGLNEHFLLAGWISVCLTIIIIIFLSKGITKPLLKMKEATSQLSKGQFSVSLPIASDDELGDLAKSIELLSRDLNYLKQERNEFLASISHELRTPLTYIKGYADIVQKRKLPDEEREKYLNIIVEETNRLSVLIKELFDLAKIDQNSFAIQKERIDLRPFFTKMEQKLSLAFQEKGINFTLQCPQNIFIQADPLRLEQIILNLLDNSIKYSQAGADIKLKAWQHKKSIHISIQDNGKGIPEKEIPLIFNRFYRVEKSRTRSLGGTGLGLAIVKELVQAHGAELHVKSKENAGTEVELIFKGELKQ